MKNGRLHYTAQALSLPELNSLANDQRDFEKLEIVGLRYDFLPTCIERDMVLFLGSRNETWPAEKCFLTGEPIASLHDIYP